MKKKLLLLGSNGQVGSACRYLLASRGETFLAPERSELDLSDRYAVKAYLATKMPDVIINGAAFTEVDKAESQVEQSFALNRDL